MIWHMNKFRPHAYVSDQRGTCRVCDEIITFGFAPTTEWESARATYGRWLHEGYTLDTVLTQEHMPFPKEFCCETVTAKGYDLCGTPVKFEDVRAGNYACGRHMRKWEEDKAYAERRKADEEKRRERELFEEYEASQYQAAGEWIREHGFLQFVSEGWEAKPKWGRMNRTTSVDVIVLKEFLENIIEKLCDKSDIPTDGEQQWQAT